MNKECNWKPLFPFGVNCDGDHCTIRHFDAELLSREILKSKLVLIRDVTSPTDQDLIEFAESFRNCGFEGVLDWNGEKLFHLKQDLRKDNYIFSNERVPLHWDGAFHVEPSFLVFYCDETSGEGGETIFTDTTLVLRNLDKDFDPNAVRLEIQTEKKVHYGGKRDLSVFSMHPHTMQPTLRLAETVKTDRNPVSVKYYSTQSGKLTSGDIENQLIPKCYHSSVLVEHRWKAGDLLLVDNHALVHGRNSFSQTAKRHIRRVQIL